MVHGLELAWAQGCQRIIVEVNFQFVADFIYGRGDKVRNAENLKYRCSELLHRAWEIEVKHIYREANSLVDWLAAFGLTMDLGYHAFV
ncbi:hypothetical protein DITRI_Ditri11bG0019000 [Diplodiscus trichospermus]